MHSVAAFLNKAEWSPSDRNSMAAKPKYVLPSPVRNKKVASHAVGDGLAHPLMSPSGPCPFPWLLAYCPAPAPGKSKWGEFSVPFYTWRNQDLPKFYVFILSFIIILSKGSRNPLLDLGKTKSLLFLEAPVRDGQHPSWLEECRLGGLVARHPWREEQLLMPL